MVPFLRVSRSLYALSSTNVKIYFCSTVPDFLYRSHCRVHKPQNAYTNVITSVSARAVARPHSCCWTRGVAQSSHRQVSMLARACGSRLLATFAGGSWSKRVQASALLSQPRCCIQGVRAHCWCYKGCSYKSGRGNEGACYSCVDLELSPL